MINFPDRIDKVTSFSDLLSDIEESTVNIIAVDEIIPTEYRDIILEKSIDVMLEKSDPSNILRPYVMDSDTCEDVRNSIQNDFLMESINEEKYKKLLKDLNSFMYEAMKEEFAIGAMLPQPGQGKSNYNEVEDEDEEIMDIDEAVIDYINNPDYDYTIYVENAIGNMIKKVKTKITVNTKLLKAIGKKIVLKSKIKMAKLKKTDQIKINDLQKELVNIESQIRVLKKGLTPEAIKELENATLKMEEAIRQKEDNNMEVSADELVQTAIEMDDNQNPPQQTIKESSNVLTEAYFGKSIVLEQAEEVLGEMLHIMKLNPSGNYSTHPLNKKLESLFEKQFGLKHMYIIWDRTPINRPSEFSLVSSDILFNARYAISKDKRNGFYDRNHVHVAYIRLSVTLISSTDFTASEIMALILHNLGTNFDGSVYHRFKVLLNYVNSVFATLYGVMMGTMLGDVLLIIQPIVAQIVTIMTVSTNPGHTLLAKLNHLLERLIDIIPPLKEFSLLFGKIESMLYKIFEIGVDIYNLKKIPFYICITPLTQLATLLKKKEIDFADSFAASYGYGPALSSIIMKAEALNWINNYDYYTHRSGFYKLSTDFALFMREVLSFCLKGGSSSSRIVKMRQEMEDNIRSGDYPPELKADLFDSIKDIDEVYKKYIHCDKGDTGLVATAFVRSGLDSIFNGRTDFISSIFPDSNVRKAFGESGVECEYLDNLYDKYQETKYLLENAQNDNNISLIRRYENQIKYYEKTINTEESILTEKANIDKDMKPIIIALNRKGYKTKYSSAGHTQLRKKEDMYRDGIYEGKLYSDARIMFDDDYNFPKAPKYWIWRTVDGKDYLDVDPKSFTVTKGDMPEEAFRKWKAAYMGTLRTWVENLPERSKTSGKVETKDTKGRNVSLENTEEDMNFDDFFTEMMNDLDNEIIDEGGDSVLV